MTTAPGLRDRKKLALRHRLADVAAALFAAHGYDAVSVKDVARAADVSEQTVYNYFPTKQDLVLDRAGEILDQYDHAVRERTPGTSPAAAVRPLVQADVARAQTYDLAVARGAFAALCLESDLLRRFALEFRDRQAGVIAQGILDTTEGISPLVARAHAAALVAVTQEVTDRIGRWVLAGRITTRQVKDLARDADVALDDLDRHFAALLHAA